MSAVLAAHKHSSHHRAEVLASEHCGCFYCLGTFKPTDIKEWTDWPEGTPPEQEHEAGTTALCPKCGIDAIIGDKSGFPVERSFLQAMHEHWF